MKPRSPTISVVALLIIFIATVLGLFGDSIGLPNSIARVLTYGYTALTFILIAATSFELWRTHKLLRSIGSKKLAPAGKPLREPRIIVRLLKSLLTSDESQQNIIGDLLEEFSEFESKAAAYIWLYKQVLKSILPLIYKNVRSRLASYFGEQVR